MGHTVPISDILETERYILRSPQKMDIPFVFSASKYPGFTDGMLWEPPESIDELRLPYQKALEGWKTGEAFQFTITSKESPDLIGRISIRKTDMEHRWNIGFWTHPEAQGRGVMTEALGAVLKFGFERLNAEIIEACYATWNLASESVLRKNGFVFERFIKKGFQKKGQWIEENLLSIEKEQWKKLIL